VAVRFDAATDRVSYVPGPGDPPSDTFTIALWVYLAADLNTFTSLYRRYTTAGSGRGQLGTDADGTTLTWWPSGISFNQQMVVGQWTRVALTCTGGAVTTFAATPAGAVVTNTGSSGTVSAANQITLAGVSVGSGAEWIDGRLANVRTWSAVLSQSEIEAEWASAAPVRTTDLWAAWPLEVHTDLADHSGNARHLAAGTTSTTTEDGPPLVVDITGTATGSGGGTGAAAGAVEVAGGAFGAGGGAGEASGTRERVGVATGDGGGVGVVTGVRERDGVATGSGGGVGAVLVVAPVSRGGSRALERTAPKGSLLERGAASARGVT
jgi:hypothetical protein